MIELAFGESPAGALKMAKSMKRGDILNGVVAAFGGTEEERREAMKPRVWNGVTLDGIPNDVAALTLALDMGDISDMDTGMTARKEFLDTLFRDSPGVSDKVWETNQHTIERLLGAKETLEPVRIWICGCNPAELGGLYFICSLMAEARTPLSVVRVPEEIQKDNNIISYRGTGEIGPEEFSAYSEYEKPLSKAQRKIYANYWNILARENAPLRAVINGSLMSLPENFYDFALLANMPEEELKVARLIGNTLSQIPGVGDLWLFLRIQAMLRSGELILVSEAADGHPYSAVIKRSNNPK